MFAVKAKFIECSINSPALSLLMKYLVIGQSLKTPNFSAIHWLPRGSLVSIGQHFVATSFFNSIARPVNVRRKGENLWSAL